MNLKKSWVKYLLRDITIQKIKLKYMPDRRKFIQQTALAGAAIAFSSQIKAFAPAKKDKIKIGMIGVGLRSHEHMGNFLQRDDVDIIAVADPQQRSITEALQVFKQYNRPEPVVYKKGNYDYKNLLKRDDVDAVMARAIAAGAKETSPAQSYDYGYRQGSIVDPLGHHWLIEMVI